MVAYIIKFLKSMKVHEIKILAFIYINLKKIFLIPLISVLRYYNLYSPDYEVKKKNKFWQEKRKFIFY